MMAVRYHGCTCHQRYIGTDLVIHHLKMISKRLSETLIHCRYTAAVAAAASAAAASASSSSNGLTNNNKQDESSPPGSFGLYSAIGEITDTFEDPHASALVSADKGRIQARAPTLCHHCLSRFILCSSGLKS